MGGSAEPRATASCLRGADACALAFDGARLVGFTTAMSDGALFVFIPLLEVLSEHRGRGIGTELLRRVTNSLSPTYGTYVCCDEDVVPFYERAGFDRVVGMVRQDPAAAGSRA